MLHEIELLNYILPLLGDLEGERCGLNLFVIIFCCHFLKKTHQKPDFMAKIHQIQFRLVFCPVSH